MINLVDSTIDNSDIDHLIEWLKTYPKLTKGDKTLEFEAKFSEYIGVKHALFVNSGSSANLLMLTALIETGQLKVGDEVVVPALSWATDLAPVMQLGLVPILCDCNLLDFSIDLVHFEQICDKHDIKALLLVSVLGYVPDMETIECLCKENNVILLEDCCESLGSEYRGHPLGSFGTMSSFSLFFGHHISTIEGGMICTSDSYLYDILLSIRSHGWDRDCSDQRKMVLRKKWGVSEFNSMYTFYHPGYNVRSTDLQAVIGLRQMDKLESVVEKRHSNFIFYSEMLGREVPDPEVVFTSNFAFPILSERRSLLVEAFKKEGIACRPLVCGSMGSQPMYIKKYGDTPNTPNMLHNAMTMHRTGLYVPNHPDMSKDDIIMIKEVYDTVHKSD